MQKQEDRGWPAQPLCPSCTLRLATVASCNALHIPQNDLSNRLRPDEDIQTAAVFLADDDVLLRWVWYWLPRSFMTLLGSRCHACPLCMHAD